MKVLWVWRNTTDTSAEQPTATRKGPSRQGERGETGTFAAEPSRSGRGRQPRPRITSSTPAASHARALTRKSQL